MANGIRTLGFQTPDRDPGSGPQIWVSWDPARDPPGEVQKRAILGPKSDLVWTEKRPLKCLLFLGKPPKRVFLPLPFFGVFSRTLWQTIIPLKKPQKSGFLGVKKHLFVGTYPRLRIHPPKWPDLGWIWGSGCPKSGVSAQIWVRRVGWMDDGAIWDSLKED